MPAIRLYSGAHFFRPIPRTPWAIRSKRPTPPPGPTPDTASHSRARSLANAGSPMIRAASHTASISSRDRRHRHETGQTSILFRKQDARQRYRTPRTRIDRQRTDLAVRLFEINKMLRTARLRMQFRDREDSPTPADPVPRMAPARSLHRRFQAPGRNPRAGRTGSCRVHAPDRAESPKPGARCSDS